MTKLIVQEKKIRKEVIQQTIEECCEGKEYKFKYIRNYPNMFFPNGDLSKNEVAEISKELNMEIISLSSVRAVIGY